MDGVQIQNTGTGQWSSVWYIKNPTTGSNTVRVTCFGITTLISCGSISFKNVEGKRGEDTNQIDANSTTCTIACQAKDWLIDAVGNPGGTIASHGADQTEFFTCSSSYHEGTYKGPLASGGDIDMYHATSGASQAFAHACIAIYPTTASSRPDILVQWDANVESDLAGYKLYYGTTSRNNGGYQKPNYFQIIPAGTETYEMTNVEDGLHYFSLTAFDTSNNESEFSNEVFTEIPFPLPAKIEEPIIININ
jgi:hypothetical protein